MKEHTELISQAGRRLGDDFRRIREKSNLSLDDLHESTLITVTLLSAFEKTALFNYSHFNDVYLRHLVRAYAKSVAIAPEIAVEALEEARRGVYRGRLASEYLGESLVSSPPDKEDSKSQPRGDRWRPTRRAFRDLDLPKPDSPVPTPQS